MDKAKREIPEFRRKDSCPICGHGSYITWIETGALGWCRRHEVLLCPDPSKLSRTCETCGDAAEFVHVSPWCNQYSCRTHVGTAGGPVGVYGLTDRAIAAVAKWTKERYQRANS
jgi:hypothetical protein